MLLGVMKQQQIGGKKMISKVRKRRLLKGLTLDNIFIQTKIDISKLSRIERGIFKPSEKEKKLISKALKAKAEELFPEEKKIGKVNREQR